MWIRRRELKEIEQKLYELKLMCWELSSETIDLGIDNANLQREINVLKGVSEETLAGVE